MRTDINWIPCPPPLNNAAAKSISATSGAAVGIPAADLAFMAGSKNEYLAKVKVTAYPAAWQEDGTTATGADANTTPVGGIFYLESLYAMKKFSAIGVGGTAVLAITYYQAI